MLDVKLERFREAVKIVGYGVDKASFRIRFQPKRPVAFTPDGPVNAWIAYFHCQTILPNSKPCQSNVFTKLLFLVLL